MNELEACPCTRNGGLGALAPKFLKWEGGSTAEAPPAADEARRVLAQRSGFFKGVRPAEKSG